LLLSLGHYILGNPWSILTFYSVVLSGKLSSSW
jgi:hypothetical protein